MSHFTCAVFANSPNDFIRLIMPYRQNNEDYFVFRPLTTKRLNELKVEMIDYLQRHPDCNPSEYSFDCFLSGRNYMNCAGTWGTWSNPNAIWDYYTPNGRDWIYTYKRGHHPDSDGNVKKSDVNFFKVDLGEAKEAAEFWDGYVLGEDPNIQGLYKREYYLERYKTKEEYAKECSRTVPYYFITPDGKLHAPGKMGWFGCSDETLESWQKYVAEFDDFVLNAPDCYVNFMDMHI